MLTWKATLNDNSEISDNFTANKANITKITIYNKRYIYEDPSSSEKEVSMYRFVRHIDGAVPEFKRTETTEIDYAVTDGANSLIEEHYVWSKRGTKLIGFHVIADDNNVFVNNETGEVSPYAE